MRDKVLFLIWVFAFVFVPRLSFAAEIINYNFNTQSFGILSHGSYWTMQPSGGVDNSPAVRLEYSVAGTSDKALGLALSSYESNEYYVEFDVRADGVPSGGSKYVKFFGSSVASQNNMTFGLSYTSNTQKEVSYYGDTICSAAWDGTTGGSCTPTFVVQSSTIDIRGGTWGRYKLWVKRASPGVENGEVKVWWNGVLRAHITEMDSNPSSSSTAFFYSLELGGYNHSTFNGTPWYLWIDNLVVSAEAIPTPICDFGHPYLCTTEETCEAVSGLHWCYSACWDSVCDETPTAAGAASLGGTQGAGLGGGGSVMIQ